MNPDKSDFQIISINLIKIGPRLRKEFGDIDALAKSIKDFGLLQPIVITNDKWLVAGERRLRAVKSLGWIEVPVVILPIKYSGVAA